jgi:hypothetical protein
MESEVCRTGKSCFKFGISVILLFTTLLIIALLSPICAHAANTMSNSYFNVTIGSYGEIYSLQLANDSFPTNYVMNTSNAPNQNTAGHQWVGELMFKYKLGSASSYSTAYTQASSDVRAISQSGNTVTVTYQNSANTNGIKNFKLVETYSLVNDYLLWSATITNTGSQTLTIGDWGYPLPFNEFWTAGDAIYETRAVDHSFTGKNSSYLYVTRPSGIGSFLLMVPEDDTGAGFEYQDHWRTAEHSSSSETAWCQDQSGWQNGLNVFYIHSDSIKSTNRGYLPNTSLTLAAGASKTYSFKFFKVADEAAMKAKLYSEGLIDVTVVPGMIVSTDMTAKFDLHTSKTINSITAKYPSATTITSLGTVSDNHKLYSIRMSTLGQNDITINYGSGETTTLQFYVIEPLGTALQRHSSFMVNSTQWGATGDIRAYVFDDWMMDTQAKRNSFAGYWGWGDDWGLTHAEFLAEKNVQTPVASEITALDNYLQTAIWTNLMNGHQSDYLIHDFLMYGTNTTPTYRGYAYPHVYNTYFSMYKIAKNYPNLVTYKNSKNTYLLRCYNIFKALYGSGVSYNWNTGLMGELTTPEIIQALRDEGYTTEANTLAGYMTTKYNNFSGTTYPYGSEYSYDNTGEEAVYTLAKMNGNATMMSKINLKTRACRGNQPVWYYYANPVTNCGENWWNFQYTMALAGYCMDDYLRYYSTNREVDQRMSYAAKMGLLSSINSGQISSASANIGTVSWTYQAEKGNLGGQGVGNGTLQNGWRDMSGEADLGLFGALKILSSDVSIDPIFGLFGYGCDVSSSGGNYVVTPMDGVNKKLNLITEKLYIELDRDKYTSATVATAKNYVELALANQYTTAAHTTKLSIFGLAAGTYNVLVDNVAVSSFTAAANTKYTVNLAIGTNSSYNIKITAGTAVNTAPVVNAGADASFVLPSSITLTGTATDDGLPSGSTLTTTWSLESGPASAAIANPGSLNTTATVSTPGAYVFKLTATDGALTSSDTVTITVSAALPELIAHYTFDGTAADSSGSGKNATLSGTTSYAAGKIGNALVLDGSSGYASLPSGIVSGLNDFSITTWVKAGDTDTWSRVFDFGTGMTTYMFLTVNSGSYPRYAITTSGNGSEQKVTGTAAFTTGTWHHIAVTQSGSTATLYIDGSAAASNTSTTLKPSGLGTTTQNYIGRSEWSSDPYLNASIDDFRIYSRALSAAEVNTLYTGAGPANTAPVVNAGNDASYTSGSAITLTGTATDDGLPAGSALSTAWSLVSGPGIAVIASPGALSTAVTVSATGTYVFQLSATDGTLTSTDTVTITVNAPSTELVARYTFDNTAADSSGNGYDATLTGTTSYAAGHSGDALVLDGSSGYASLPSGIVSSLSDFTVSTWVKAGDVDTWSRIFDFGTGTTKYMFLTVNAASYPRYAITASGYSAEIKVNGTAAFTTGAWHHVAITQSGNTATLYIDGAAAATNTGATLSPSGLGATTQNYIGKSQFSTDPYLNGSVDDFRIYSRALSAAEISAIYAE